MRSHGGLLPAPPSLSGPPSTSPFLSPSDSPAFLNFVFSSAKVAPLVASSMECSPPGYRRNVGICLVNPDNKIFSASRLDVPGAWQMPQGGIEGEEDARIAAFREWKEETGVTSAEILAEAVDFMKSVYEDVLKFFKPHLRSFRF